MIIFILIIVGLALGSFVNALVWRLHIQQGSKHNSDLETNQSTHRSFKRIFFSARNDPYSILMGRSMCPDCHHLLAVKDLVPVLSWLELHGRCRYCQKSISWEYPVVELLVAILFTFSYFWWPLGFNGLGVFTFIFWLFFLTAFVALAVYDLRWFILPNRIVYPLIGLALAEVIGRATFFGAGWPAITQAFWGVIVIAGLFALLYLVSKGLWIGLGDVKLAVVLGLLAGGPIKALLLIFIASILGSIISVPMLIKGRTRLTSPIPFGPFLLASTIIIVLSGSNLANFYNNIFYLH